MKIINDYLPDDSLGEELLEDEYINTMLEKDQEEIWVTRYGKEIKIKDMDTKHIHNCIKMLKKEMVTYSPTVKTEAQSYIELFLKEIVSREKNKIHKN